MLLSKTFEKATILDLFIVDLLKDYLNCGDQGISNLFRQNWKIFKIYKSVMADIFENIKRTEIVVDLNNRKFTIVQKS